MVTDGVSSDLVVMETSEVPLKLLSIVTLEGSSRLVSMDSSEAVFLYLLLSRVDVVSSDGSVVSRVLLVCLDVDSDSTKKKHEIYYEQ